jgi:hypothetical protein
VPAPLLVECIHYSSAAETANAESTSVRDSAARTTIGLLCLFDDAAG